MYILYHRSCSMGDRLCNAFRKIFKHKNKKKTDKHVSPTQETDIAPAPEVTEEKPQESKVKKGKLRCFFKCIRNLCQKKKKESSEAVQEVKNTECEQIQQEALICEEIVIQILKGSSEIPRDPSPNIENALNPQSKKDEEIPCDPSPNIENTLNPQSKKDEEIPCDPSPNIENPQSEKDEEIPCDPSPNIENPQSEKDNEEKKPQNDISLKSSQLLDSIPKPIKESVEPKSKKEEPQIEEDIAPKVPSKDKDLTSSEDTYDSSMEFTDESETSFETESIESLFYDTLDEIDTALNHVKVDTSNQTTIADFKLQHELGSGNFGKVYRAEHRQTRRIVAIKTQQKSTVTTLAQYRSILVEQRILLMAKRLQNPFLVGLFASFSTENHICFAMDYAEDGDLASKLSHGAISLKRTIFYSSCIVLGLKFLHDNKVVHR
ncbi:protein kinase C-like 1 [Xenopus laevis]|uniref:non-specific serine/threonine protein kinase n=1 Tax=Xenopus laevis TaxID=8355 RepID=A0A8J1LAS8_XENLA|nr:protein kinase C-like 1 [Xenopus laevis]